MTSLSLDFVYITNHPLLYWAEEQVPWDTEFHTFAVEWRVNTSLSFFVDDHHLVTLDAADADKHG